MSDTCRKIIWLLAAALAIRVLFAWLYPPAWFSDSDTYLEMAWIIRTGDFSSYTGERTPLYPLILLLFKAEPRWLMIFQAVLGLVISLILFQSFKVLFQSERLGLAAGLSYALNPSQVVFERAVLTETTTTFLITASLLLFIYALRKKLNLLLCLLVGVLSSLAAFIRPLFQFLPLLLALLLGGYYFYRFEHRIAASALRFSLVVLPAVLLLGGWSLFNYNRIGYFGITTLGGFNLTNHTGAFMEDAPEEFAQIKRIFLKHRERALERTGSSAMTIWRAIDELERETGLSYPELSNRFLQLSLHLILKNPGRYLRSVAKSFVIFWLPTWYTGQGGLIRLVRSGTPLERYLLSAFWVVHAACMLIFMALPLFYLLCRGIRNHFKFNFGVLTMYAVVFSTAIVQAFLEYGENARYKQPVEPFVIALAVTFALTLWRYPANSAKEEVDN